MIYTILLLDVSLVGGDTVLLKCYNYPEVVAVVEVDTEHFVYRNTGPGYIPCHGLHLGGGAGLPHLPDLPTLEAGGCEAAGPLIPAEVRASNGGPHEAS